MLLVVAPEPVVEPEVEPLVEPLVDEPRVLRLPLPRRPPEVVLPLVELLREPDVELIEPEVLLMEPAVEPVVEPVVEPIEPEVLPLVEP